MIQGPIDSPNFLLVQFAVCICLTQQIWSHFQNNKFIIEPNFMNDFCDKVLCVLPNESCRNHWSAVIYMFFTHWVYVNFWPRLYLHQKYWSPDLFIKLWSRCMSPNDSHHPSSLTGSWCNCSHKRLVQWEMVDSQIQQMPGEQSQCTKQGEPDFPRGFGPSQHES